MEKQLDKDAINAFNDRIKGAVRLRLTLPGVCESLPVEDFTDELKVKYMYTLWAKQEKYFEEVRKENGDN